MVVQSVASPRGFGKSLKLHVSQFQSLEAEQELVSSHKFKCSGCSEEFNNKRILNFHLKREHPELLGIQKECLKCAYCDIICASKHELNYHIYNTHKRASKYICDTCGKGFLYMSRLEAHKVVHLKGALRKEHVCHLCGCDYTAKYSLEMHYKRFHPDDPIAQGLETSKKVNIQTQDEFKCKYCDLTSPFQVDIKRHLQTHKEEM